MENVIEHHRKQYLHLCTVIFLVQNSMDLDRKVDKYSWWRAAVATSTKLGRKGNDPGLAYLWNITGCWVLGHQV